MLRLTFRYAPVLSMTGAFVTLSNGAERSGNRRVTAEDAPP